MIGRFSISTPNASAGRHLLLGGWRDVLEDARRLAADLRRARDTCDCRHTGSEPGGSCPCCQTGMSQTLCSNCAAQVNALGQRCDKLIDDATRFLPVVAFLLDARGATDELAQLESIRLLVAAVENTFRRLATGSAEFRRGCRSSHAKELGTAADDLVCQLWALDQMLEPGGREWAELSEIERARVNR